MDVWLGPLTESEVRFAQTMLQIHRGQLQMPPESHAALMFSPEAVGERTSKDPDGQITMMVLVDSGPLPLGWTVPTKRLRGGKGMKFELFGRLVEPGTDGPTWTVELKSGRPAITFQPWLIRAYKPGSPLVAQILWTPELNRDHKSFDWVADDWDGKAYDKWQSSAGLAMKFLHDFERSIDGGRPKKSQARALAEVAAAGLDYLRAHPDTTVEDLQHQHLASAMLRTPEAHEQFMTRHKLKISDVKRTIADFQAREFS
jgi:hypothetical protein